LRQHLGQLAQHLDVLRSVDIGLPAADRECAVGEGNIDDRAQPFRHVDELIEGVVSLQVRPVDDLCFAPEL
ncbi:MAG: hypothetical protein CME04_22770, partial [Gemmatimonadaceae bacterium]|nr:hypothetical protein [Gemmatimonadaceae bacterium]